MDNEFKFEEDVEVFSPIFDFESGPVLEDIPEQHISASDALVDCVNKYGRVDMPYMAQISGLPVDKLIEDLCGSIFQLPELFIDSEAAWDRSKGWVLRNQYLTGNILNKLKQAQEANKRFPGCFDDNIAALSEIMPEALSVDDIHVSLGATWIPADFYSDFIKNLLGFNSRIPVYYCKELCTWKVDPPADDEKNSVLNTLTYGTSRIRADRIIEHTMNVKTVKVEDYI